MLIRTSCHNELLSRKTWRGIGSFVEVPTRWAADSPLFVVPLFCCTITSDVSRLLYVSVCLPEDLDDLGDDSKEEPVDLEGSQQKVHDQKPVEEPCLSRPVVFDDALFVDVIDVGP